MPTYIEITSDTDKAYIQFNDLKGAQTPSGKIPEKRTYYKNMLVISLNSDGLVSVLVIPESTKFLFSFDGSPETLQIDKINNVTITSNSQLYDELTSM